MTVSFSEVHRIMNAMSPVQSKRDARYLARDPLR